MIDFEKANLSYLVIVENSKFYKMICNIMIDGEEIISSYKNKEYKVVFTSKRIIILEVQGLIHKDKDFLSLPYSSILFHSIDGEKNFSKNCRLYVHIKEIGKIKFHFRSYCNIEEICKNISNTIL